MPVEHRFEPEHNLVTVAFTGTFRFDDVAAAFLERVRHPDHRPGMNILLDGREAMFDFSSQDVRRLVEFFDRHRQDRGSGFRLALASAEDATFGMGRMFEAYGARLPEQIRVFRDIDEARRWALGKVTP